MNATSKTITTSTPRRSKETATVAAYLARQIELSDKSQKEIATEAGFAKPNMVSMIKQGDTRLPIAKIGPIARALGIDPVHLFRMTMMEYEPETWLAISSVLGQPFISDNEMEIINVIRESNVVNPKIRTQEDRNLILDAVSKLKPENEALGD